MLEYDDDKLLVTGVQTGCTTFQNRNIFGGSGSGQNEYLMHVKTDTDTQYNYINYKTRIPFR